MESDWPNVCFAAGWKIEFGAAVKISEISIWKTINNITHKTAKLKTTFVKLS